ncbi:MAG TPA: V-type ATPase subunit [Candidatus Lachnoclostridium pullistercoris]|uniref:V-type ATPase subunit n=1 Tax=Candidatus Lachnoclostridium pullistercoris TaxID=2838632 RepID=A0A9D2PC96_9FIRM|nr:V-type ATPase subunit [Candidatus Lachnoclostridium pullistercoris]
MGNLLTYSGLTTKVRAMESRFLSDQQLEELASLSSVGEALDFLRSQPAYGEVLSGADSTIHRSDLEKLLLLSRYRDFEKLYRFSGPEPRKFLNLYFSNFEISLLKRCLRGIAQPENGFVGLSAFQEFFSRHSRLNVEQLAAASSVPELTAALKGTSYYALFSRLEEGENVSLFDYEMQLDLLHFKREWKIKDKFTSKDEQKTLTQCFGSQLDMLNIQWIYRSKKYYHLEPADIYTLLIPVSYRLKQGEITRLAETGSLDEFFSVLAGTYYGSQARADLRTSPDLEALYEQVMNRVYSMTARKHPYSAAILNSYFYFKNLEIHRLITAIECIRYGIEPGEILSYIIKDNKGGNGK